MMNRIILSALCFLLTFSSFSQGLKNVHVQDVLKNLPRTQRILVVAHRGDWRHAPENSLQAMQNCIDMGVDMVEIDIRRTKDGALVLMHDDTLDRASTGKGLVSDYTLDHIHTLRLRDGLGVPTAHTIPTLEEVLLLCKGKIMINIDKGYDWLDECYKVMERTGTTAQVILKGKKSKEEVQQRFGALLDKITFMPIVDLATPNATAIIDGYLSDVDKPLAVELTVRHETSETREILQKLYASKVNIWVNALWPHHNDGHDDEKAAVDPTVYDWFLKHHVSMIQTDRPQLLIDYLQSRAAHSGVQR